MFLESGIPAAGGAEGMGAMDGMDPDYGDEEELDDSGMDPGTAALAQFAQNPSFLALRDRMVQNPQFYNEFMQML